VTALPVWNEEIYVRNNECDFQGFWKPSQVFLAFTEAASHHAAHLGFSFDDLLARSRAWVLSRMKIRFFSPSEMGATLTLRTWPRAIEQKIFFRRDFQLFDERGILLSSGASNWLLIDLEARRFVMPHTLGTPLPPNEGLAALPEQLEKIVPPENLPVCLSITPAYSAIDALGHVNNTRYVEWMMDCIPYETHQAHRVETLQINYSSEVRPGQPVSVAAAPGEDDPLQWHFLGSNLATGVRAFEGQVRLSNHTH